MPIPATANALCIIPQSEPGGQRRPEAREEDFELGMESDGASVTLMRSEAESFGRRGQSNDVGIAGI
jgi:hypothetical protein